MGLNIRRRSEWSREAACLKADLEEIDKIFFPERGRPKEVPPWQPFCESCPVFNECLSWAIVHRAQGVWGGTTEKQRASISPSVVETLDAQAKSEGWYEPYYDWIPRGRNLVDQTLEPLEFLESEVLVEVSPLDDPSPAIQFALAVPEFLMTEIPTPIEPSQSEPFQEPVPSFSL